MTETSSNAPPLPGQLSDNQWHELTVPNPGTRVLIACSVGISRSFNTLNILRNKYGRRDIVMLSGGIYSLQDYVYGLELTTQSSSSNMMEQNIMKQTGLKPSQYYKRLANSSIKFAFLFADIASELYDAHHAKYDFLPLILPRGVKAQTDIRDTSGDRIAKLIIQRIGD